MNFESMINEYEKRPDPLTEIEVIRNQIMQTGAADRENSIINSIKENFKEGVITGEEAVQQVRALQNSRSDYH
ncbi:MAG: hypothetical protein QY304_02545 [Candidatus Paceibacterota bacterium]|nr:MAG: hypothetical protein QY304_02545 [Candidatus Paceibacterota bacterium]